MNVVKKSKTAVKLWYPFGDGPNIIQLVVNKTNPGRFVGSRHFQMSHNRMNALHKCLAFGGNHLVFKIGRRKNNLVMVCHARGARGVLRRKVV